MKKGIFGFNRIIYPWLIIVLFSISGAVSCKSSSQYEHGRTVAELNVGESKEMTLGNGDVVKLELLQVDVISDSMRNAIRAAHVKIRLDDKEMVLTAGSYNLPVHSGNIQIDCPAVKNYYSNSSSDQWKLEKDARFRIWPEDSPLLEPGSFVYPLKQKWFAGVTQSGNEPTYVDWGENPFAKNIYYHAGHDFGGAEGLDEIVSATDGLVIASANEVLKGYDTIPAFVNPDAISILDNRGWLVEYAHLDTIYADIKPGTTVKMGQKIGLMGQQGTSGGWVHLHFQLSYRHPVSGKWAVEDAYPYLWEAYVNEYDPPVIAVARPHHFVWTGQEVILDGSKSKSLSGEIGSYEWTFTDSTSATGAIQKRTYSQPGEYSEILKVTDSNGKVDYDFAIVQVRLREDLAETIPVMQAAYHPSLKIKAGDPVAFLVRTFNTTKGNETWNFGDGSPLVTTRSETPEPPLHLATRFTETVHSYTNPGQYIVRVERENEKGWKAVMHLHVSVE